MKRKRFIAYIVSLIMAVAGSALTCGCGTLRTHWGMEHEYQYDFPDGGGGHHHHKKQKKHKKEKKHKKHHHDDD